FEEQHLRASLARVDLRRQRRGIGKFKRDVAFPFGLQRRHIDDDAATGIGTFSQADGQDAAGNAEILHRAGQGEGVGRNNAHFAGKIDKGLFIEGLGVDDGRIDIGEYLEFVGAAHVVAVAAGAIADDAVAIDRTNLARLERLYHSSAGRLPDPTVVFYAHSPNLITLARILSPVRQRSAAAGKQIQSLENQR